MIKVLTKKQFSDYLDNKYQDDCNLFITYDSGKYVGLDDTTNNKWVEEFDKLEDCIGWLKGEFEVNVK